jgi:hypothetical protein
VSNYARDCEKIVIYLKPGSSNGPLALRAVDSMKRKGYDDCVFRYGDEFTFWAKKNKAGITVRELDD